ncbi:MAG: hypothetical protein DRJ64_10370 [Thermoprotei archaeon]|nr:MAG: hypothetical protein DRJ64_10370 [Thermoprotei archaeon]
MLKRLFELKNFKVNEFFFPNILSRRKGKLVIAGITLILFSVFFSFIFSGKFTVDPGMCIKNFSYLLLLSFFILLLYYHMFFEVLEEFLKGVIMNLKDKKDYLSELIDLSNINEKFSFYSVFSLSIILLFSLLVKILNLNDFFLFFTIMVYSSFFSIVAFLLGKRIAGDYKGLVYRVAREGADNKILLKNLLGSPSSNIFSTYFLSYIFALEIYGNTIRDPLNLTIVILSPLVLYLMTLGKIEFDMMNIDKEIFQTRETSTVKTSEAIEITVPSESKLTVLNNDRYNMKENTESVNVSTHYKEGTEPVKAERIHEIKNVSQTENVQDDKVEKRSLKKRSKKKARKRKVKRREIKPVRNIATRRESDVEQIAKLLLELDESLRKLASGRQQVMER